MEIDKILKCYKKLIIHSKFITFSLTKEQTKRSKFFHKFLPVNLVVLFQINLLVCSII